MKLKLACPHTMRIFGATGRLLYRTEQCMYRGDTAVVSKFTVGVYDHRAQFVLELEQVRGNSVSAPMYLLLEEAGDDVSMLCRTAIGYYETMCDNVSSNAEKDAAEREFGRVLALIGRHLEPHVERLDESSQAHVPAVDRPLLPFSP